MNIVAFLETPLHIQIHALAAIAALVVGAVQLLAPKGNVPHKILGMVFVVLMLTAALTALFITKIFPGSFSPIHLFIPLTLVSLYHLIRTARANDGKAHKKKVLGLYFGALILPGLFTFLPERLMYQVFFGG